MSRATQQRRTPLVLGSLALVGSMFLGSGSAGSAGSQAAPQKLTRATLAQAAAFRLEPEAWADPPDADGSNPRYPLVVRYGDNTVRVGEDGRAQRVHLRSYNGGLVGPTFRLEPGQTLKLDLINQLPMVAGGTGHHASGDHPGINSTNLHTHGLHISPSGKSDDVLREVKPAETADYDFAILPAGNPPGEPPMSHYPGTFWYHAHMHGNTAVQLASGMAGALLVQGDIDNIPQVATAHERIFVFQQLAFDKDGEVKSLDDVFNNWTTGEKKHTTINGKVKPLIELRPGQVERWRMIDSGLIELLDMSLRPEADPSRTVPFQAIAFDGITLKSVQERTQIELAPGNRADVLIKAPTTLGTYLLYKERPKLHLTALLLTGKAAAKVDLPEILAVVEVAGDPCKEGEKGCSSHLLPPGAPLPAPLPDITASEVGPQVRSVRFLVKDNKFTINGRVFDPAVVNPEFLLTKGKAEEWLIENENDGVPHPFHIHVNAFQLVNADGSPGEWRDTIVLAPLQKLKVRMRYERFTGTFVVHCHNLVHEDRGMMQLVQIK